MRLWSRLEERTWLLTLRLDPEESLNGLGQSGMAVRLVTNRCTVGLPEHVIEPHPDLLALAAFTIGGAWVSRRLTFRHAISPLFAETLADQFGIVAGPVDDHLSPRTCGSRVGLCYSGGADSVAVSATLPSDSPHLHFQRVPHPRVPNRAMHYRADVAAALAGRAGDRGRNVAVVQSDLEYLCLPWPTYPTWPALAVGPVLMADHLNLGAVGFGTVLEARYLGDGRRYDTGDHAAWGKLFAAVGLPFYRPAAGLTEVGTIRLASESDLADLIRSCSLGGLDGPCLACPKCLRKELLTAAITGQPLNKTLLRNLTDGSPAMRHLEGKRPYTMQPVIEWALARVPGLEHTALARVAHELAPSAESTAWVERYYRPALSDEVPAKFRLAVERFVTGRFDWMTREQELIVESWNPAAPHPGSSPAGPSVAQLGRA